MIFKQGTLGIMQRLEIKIMEQNQAKERRKKEERDYKVGLRGKVLTETFGGFRKEAKQASEKKIRLHRF